MGGTQLRVIGAGLSFVLIFLLGFWLSRSGKPYSPIIFNLHKLIGLAALVLLAVTVYRVNQVAPLSTAGWIAAAVTGLLFIATIVSGGLVSLDQPMPAFVSLMHKAFPYFTVLSTAVTLYLLLGRQR